MAIILQQDGTPFSWSNYTKTPVEDWTAVTVAFEAVKIPSSFSFSVPTPVWGDIVTGDGVERVAALIVNEAGEPNMRQSGWLCVTSQDEATTSVTYYSDARGTDANRTLQELATPATLVKTKGKYAIEGDEKGKWELVNLPSSWGGYSLAFYKLTDDIKILANGVKVESGTDKDGKALKEAVYTDGASSWRLPLAAALPAKKLADVLTAYYWPFAKRLIYDPDGRMTATDKLLNTGRPRYTPLVEAIRPLSEVDPCDHNGTVELLHSLTDVKLGTELYPATRGAVKYAEGWTDTLLQWTKEGYAGADEATVCTIGVNGQATTGNYLDDSGKPYSGLVFYSRPEPAGNVAFLEQFAMTKHARKITFKCVDPLPANATIPLGTGSAWVTKRTRTAAGYDYEGVAVTHTDVELLTSSTLIFPPTGGAKWVAGSGYGLSWQKDGLDEGAWPVSVTRYRYTSSSVTNSVVTVGANPYATDPDSLAESEASTIKTWLSYDAETNGIKLSDYYRTKVSDDLKGKLAGYQWEGKAVRLPIMDVNIRVVGWQLSQDITDLDVNTAEQGVYAHRIVLYPGETRLFAGYWPYQSDVIAAVACLGSVINIGLTPLLVRVVSGEKNAVSTTDYSNWQVMTVTVTASALIYAGYIVNKPVTDGKPIATPFCVANFVTKQY